MAERYYDILGVSRNATEKEIKSAYRTLARQLHPDVNAADKTAEEKFKKVNEAYAVVGDTQTRRDYDEFGDNWKHAEQLRKSGASGGAFGRGGPAGSIFDMFRGRRGSGGGGIDLGDLFGDSGGFGTAGMGMQQATGSVEISLAEAYRGTTRRISVAGPAGGTQDLEVTIPAGIGDGGKINLRPSEQMQVTLTVRVRSDNRFVREGADLLANVQVPLLDAILGGETEVSTMNGRVALKIPAGTQNGKSFRMRGKGMPRLNSTKKGDLIATVRVRLPESLSEEEQSLFEKLKAIKTHSDFDSQQDDMHPSGDGDES